jgi:hypothetical protein
MSFGQRVNNAIEGVLRASRRLDRYYRDGFDKVARAPLVAIVQFYIDLLRRRDNLRIAEEKLIPGEERIAQQITEEMSNFLRKTYAGGRVALRAGKTKTHGLLRAWFEVPSDLPPELEHGLFARPGQHPAWVRLAGPGPLAPADLDDNGILSMSIKVMGLDGPKLFADEHYTQDFTGISAPTFTTPNVVENLKLQKQIGKGTPVFYFLNPFDSHYLDAIMQGLYSRAHANPLELTYYSCVPYALGPGQAIKYSMRPVAPKRGKVPARPGPNYLREAMANTLANSEVVFDVLVQLQTDARRMPIENASVIWSEKLSPSRKVATLRIPVQSFTSEEQLAFDRRLSFNPWHSLPEHQPLGNQNRARRLIYHATSLVRQTMNHDPRVEPTGAEEFPDSPSLLPAVAATPRPL